MGKQCLKKRCYAHPETTLNLMKCRGSVECLFISNTLSGIRSKEVARNDLWSLIFLTNAVVPQTGCNPLG